MSKPAIAQHRIETIADLIAVATEDNLDTLTRDLTLFLGVHIAVREAPAVTSVPVFWWNDDNTPGIRGIHLELPERT